MKVPAISFCAKFQVEDVVRKEQDKYNDACRLGVDTPLYTYKDYILAYETKGETADCATNPIQKEHLDNLFKNLYLMDRGNFYHQDLDIGHVFYAKDGSVEFDCFRFSVPFIKDGRKNCPLPDFISPTNQINYENASLGAYVNQFDSEKEKTDFIRQYLIASSAYHQKRSETDDDYEAICAEVNKNPDDNTVNLRALRLDFLNKQRQAFTEWDEGGGACGHKQSPMRQIKAIPLYLEAVKSGIKYTKKADELSKKEDGIKKEYYDYERQIGEYFVNLYLSWVQGMANWMFESKDHCPKPENIRTALNEQYTNMLNNSDLDEKESMINSYIESYCKQANI